jgi:hypothetical protein
MWGKSMPEAFSFRVFVSVVLTSMPIAAYATDWAQPPLLCVEEVVPKVPDRECLDLSKVVEPAKDFPSEISAEDLAFWKAQKFGLSYCRALEILKREEANPGSQKASSVEISWMRKTAVLNHDLKVNAVYQAAHAYDVPPHILTGALFQESIFSELGVAEDGGNFSCGVAQLNSSEWCRWANSLTSSQKTQIGWPRGAVDCVDDANPVFIKPFYAIALTRLGGLPEYRLQPEHFKDIAFTDVVAGFPEGTAEKQKLRYQTSRSFLDHCGEPVAAITAKAHELERLYTEFVPQGMKMNQIYKDGEKFNRVCAADSTSRAYPLNTGWLLAVGAYNAGPKAVDIMAAYKNWNRSDVAKAETFSAFDAKSLIESIYKAGVYNSTLNVLEMNDLDGLPMKVKWMKMCVLQRHIARVVQHVTQPNIPPLADTLEGPQGCNTFPGNR